MCVCVCVRRADDKRFYGESMWLEKWIIFGLNARSIANMCFCHVVTYVLNICRVGVPQFYLCGVFVMNIGKRVLHYGYRHGILV